MNEFRENKSWLQTRTDGNKSTINYLTRKTKKQHINTALQEKQMPKLI